MAGLMLYRAISVSQNPFFMTLRNRATGPPCTTRMHHSSLSNIVQWNGPRPSSTQRTVLREVQCTRPGIPTLELTQQLRHANRRNATLMTATRSCPYPFFSTLQPTNRRSQGLAGRKSKAGVTTTLISKRIFEDIGFVFEKLEVKRHSVFLVFLGVRLPQ
ncbi:uncharacterized protein BDZ99DRAFT_115435 [Mytilinidion resinicola]|uniref:Uncharacterized protein n=1 Tax=Mytilinidion resinicola TaxID=574789 RepID=A0A6A6Y9A4_9PEZI|nr:uncharacterized protein BDZ99DRAFT_115435 [Mytilinidion resinicola]KAF2805219.1 hypothetical protein BDZ99DRAFT_115435 [Mytilinidion resinicola]